MGKPKVSVIVPVYNTEKYLPSCLDSIINQTFKDIEIICVNDGSTDNSFRILKQYKQQDERIKVFNQENRGPSAARNKAIKKAKGKYIQFVDSDDQIKNNALEKLYTKAEQDNLDILMFNMIPKLVDQNSKKFYKQLLSYYKRTSMYNATMSGQEMFYQMRKNKDYLPSPVIYLINTSFLKSNNLSFYEGIIHEDNLFTIRALLSAQKVSHINEVLYIRRVRKNSIMTKEISVNKINGYLVCIKELIKIVNDLKLKKHVIEEVSNYLIYGLYKNFVKYLERLPKKEVQNYLLTLKSGDFLFFNLITKLLLVEKKRVESLESKKDVKLPYKNSRLNRYSMRIGRMILFIPHALYIFFKKNKLIKKTRSLLKKVYRKTKTLFLKTVDFLTANINCEYRSIIKYSRLGISKKAETTEEILVFSNNEDNKKPKISIIMPVYNSEEFLRDTINDILHQTYKDFELICIDDGSTDNSLKILMDFAKNDNRIIIFHKKKENAGQARNSGFKFAKGEYVIFLDADDRFESTLLEKMYNQINKMSSDICVCNADKFKDDTSEFINSNLLLSTRIPRKTVFNHKNLKANLYLFCTPCPWNKIFKKSFLKKNHIQFQNLPRANDLFFTYYALTKAKKITTINEKLVHYRIGTENSLQSTTDKTPFSSTKALLRLKNQLNKDGLFSGYIKQSFTNMAINNCIYNLKSLKDKTGKKVVLYWLKNTGLEELEITGNPKEYYLYDNTKKMEEIQKLINIYIH